MADHEWENQYYHFLGRSTLPKAWAHLSQSFNHIIMLQSLHRTFYRGPEDVRLCVP